MPKVCQHGQLLVMQPISARGKENGEAITLVASAWNQLLCKIMPLFTIAISSRKKKERERERERSSANGHEKQETTALSCDGGGEKLATPFGCDMRLPRV